MNSTDLKFSAFTACVPFSTLLGEVADGFRHVNDTPKPLPEPMATAAATLNTFRALFNTVSAQVQSGAMQWSDYAPQPVAESILAAVQAIRLTPQADTSERDHD